MVPTLRTRRLRCKKKKVVLLWNRLLRASKLPRALLPGGALVLQVLSLVSKGVLGLVLILIAHVLNQRCRQRRRA